MLRCAMLCLLCDAATHHASQLHGALKAGLAGLGWAGLGWAGLVLDHEHAMRNRKRARPGPADPACPLTNQIALQVEEAQLTQGTTTTRTSQSSSTSASATTAGGAGRADEASQAYGVHSGALIVTPTAWLWCSCFTMVCLPGMHCMHQPQPGLRRAQR